MEFLTTKQAAELWGISPRRVALLCAQGRSSGGLALRSGANPGDGQGRKDLAVAAGCEKAP